MSSPRRITGLALSAVAGIVVGRLGLSIGGTELVVMSSVVTLLLITVLTPWALRSRRARPAPGRIVEQQSPPTGNVTFAGEMGYQLCRDIGRVSAGITPISKASGALSRGSDGTLHVRVTPGTIVLLSGRASSQAAK